MSAFREFAASTFLPVFGNPEPRVDLVLSDSSVHRVKVMYSEPWMWIACDVEFDIGMPTGTGNSAAAAIEDLRIQLESAL